MLSPQGELPSEHRSERNLQVRLDRVYKHSLLKQTVKLFMSARMKQYCVNKGGTVELALKSFHPFVYVVVGKFGGGGTFYFGKIFKPYKGGHI